MPETNKTNNTGRMKMVSLRNGSEELEPIVKVGFTALQSLMETDPIGFYELVMLARDSKHKLFGGEKQENKFRDMAFIDIASPRGSPRVHDSFRNLILSAVEGDGLDMKIVSPLKQD